MTKEEKKEFDHNWDTLSEKVTEKCSPEIVEDISKNLIAMYEDRMPEEIKKDNPFHEDYARFAVLGYNLFKSGGIDNLKFYFQLENTSVGVGSEDFSYIRALYAPADYQDFCNTLYEENPDTNIFNNICIHSRSDEGVDQPRYLFLKHLEKCMYWLNFGVQYVGFSELMNTKEATVQEMLSCPNQEVKALLLSRREDVLLEALTKVDTYIDKKDPKFLVGTVESTNVGVYTLFQGEISGQKMCFVRCFCPSTDRSFLLGVEDKYTNAKDAIASLARCPKALKENLTMITRQGERFCWYFDDETTAKLNADPEWAKKVSADTVVLTGDEYFGKMGYEY